MAEHDPKNTPQPGLWKAAKWWVLAGIVVVVILSIGIVFSVQVISQTGALEATARDPAISERKDQADLVRNAYQYQTDALTLQQQI
jgi:hypothetical protein